MVAIIAIGVCGAHAQAQDSRPPIGQNVRPFVSVDAPVVALTHVRLVDGSGQPAKDDQTIVIEGARIRAVGPAASTQVPAGAQVMDLSGHTIMPGIIGLHDHMYYSSPVGGSMRPMLFSYPRLFLATGVTTIRTTGSVDSYQELNLKAAIGKGEIPGPEIHVTGPYLQGAPGSLPRRDASAEGSGRRAADGEVLGAGRRHVVQGLHDADARGTRRGDRRGAQERHQGDGASVLGRIPRSRRTRHRQPRTRPADEHRVLQRQEAR